MFLIAGPCVIESEAHALKMAEAIAGVCKALRLPYIFKASYDKANRTSLKSFRGIGMDAGLRTAIVEKSPRVGGQTAWSQGIVWIGNTGAAENDSARHGASGWPGIRFCIMSGHVS